MRFDRVRFSIESFNSPIEGGFYILPLLRFNADTFLGEVVELHFGWLCFVCIITVNYGEEEV